MKLSPLSIVLAIAAAFAAFAAISTALAHLFAALNKPRAQRIAERVGIILVAVERAAEDAAKAASAGPVAMGVAALKDLEPLAELDPSGKATIAVARVKTMAKAFGVTGLVLALVACGSGQPPPRLPKCVAWENVQIGEVGFPMCAKWVDTDAPPSSSAP